MFSRPGTSKFLDSFDNINPDVVFGLDTHSCILENNVYKMSKKAFSLASLLLDDNRADLSNYPMNDIWHVKAGKLVRITKEITKEEV